jgi:hypothetical protein
MKMPRFLIAAVAVVSGAVGGWLCGHALGFQHVLLPALIGSVVSIVLVLVGVAKRPVPR